MYYLGDKRNEVQLRAAGNADGNGMFSERASFFLLFIRKIKCKIDFHDATLWTW